MATIVMAIRRFLRGRISDVYHDAAASMTTITSSFFTIGPV